MPKNTVQKYTTKYILLFNCDHYTDNENYTIWLRYSLEPTARAKYFYLFHCMSTGGEKVVSILDIHLPELELTRKSLFLSYSNS